METTDLKKPSPSTVPDVRYERRIATGEEHPSTAPLSIHDMTVAYHRKPVLWDIDLDIHEGRLVGIVGLLNWQGISDPWLARAVEACRRHIAALRADDAHTIRGMLILLESLSLQGADVTAERARLAALLARARFLIREAPVQGYGLTPLDFTPAPDGWCRDLFTETQYAGHLADLAGRQGPDGGWPITWEPPGEAAGWVWRAHVTVRALAVLRAWGMA